MDTETIPLPIAVRAYAVAPAPAAPSKAKARARPPLAPSPWSLTFDTETTTDAAQQLRFGAYQLREGDRLHEQGLFYDPQSLPDAERSTLFAFAATHGLTVRTVAEFVEEVFFPYVHELRCLCLGLNLPFDLARLALDHDSARGKAMRGGFSFRLSPDPRRPRVQVKHLTSRAALIRFTLPPRQRTPRGMRKRGLRVPGERGYFVDVRTLAGALLSGSWSLGALAAHLQTEHQKLGTEEHGGPLTADYLEYAVGDVQTTWECFAALRARYERHGLAGTPLTRIYSEASLGKACLREMGVRPWRELQPAFPPELLGTIMSTYYGGRSEVRLRRVIARVLYCDFLSMYPTVCTLMGLWRFVVSQGMAWEDDTVAVRDLLARVTIADLQRPEAWRELTVLVQVQPDRDIFPVRAKYGAEGQRTIGLNHLTSEQPLWFTLADCLASTLLTGKSPRVLRALRFRPVGMQEDLRVLDIAGNPAYRVDPARDDFYRRLIDLRTEVKRELKRAEEANDTARAATLDTEQLALKVMANATSYGILVELNVAEEERPREVTVYGSSGEPFPSRVRNVEEPGPYFHPLLATLITGAARLMLTLTERLAADEGLAWAFCDTDSMALTRPDGMADGEFLTRAQRVRDWFTALNPYEHKGPVFKIEDANYRLVKGKPTGELGLLYCFAISAKRYALFNFDRRGRPILRKASAHGLGHLRPPYTEKQSLRSIPAPAVQERELGVARWQHDVWYRMVRAALGGHPERVDLGDLPNFDRPAVSRYAATTPALLRWFRAFNAGKPYREQVRPFGFLLAFQAASPTIGALVGEEQTLPTARRGRPRGGGIRDRPRATALYDADSGAAARRCFDRASGAPLPAGDLKTYREALAQHHLHPEAKFANADFTDAGATQRRHVAAPAVEHIGKEANRWEEQFYVGMVAEAQVEYGIAPDSYEQMRASIIQTVRQFGQRALARTTRLSLREVSRILNDQEAFQPTTLAKLTLASSHLQVTHKNRDAHEQTILLQVRRRFQTVPVREMARQLGVDAANLSRVIRGSRRPSKVLLSMLESLTE